MHALRLGVASDQPPVRFNGDEAVVVSWVCWWRVGGCHHCEGPQIMITMLCFIPTHMMSLWLSELLEVGKYARKSISQYMYPST
jgi:hypothetical protein